MGIIFGDTEFPLMTLTFILMRILFNTPLNSAGNQVGAAFGTGYCDAQCPHDVKYINGEPNSQVKMTVMTVE